MTDMAGDMDRAYANSAFIAKAEAFPPAWAAAAAACRTQMGVRAECDVAYGPAPRQQMDIFHPHGSARGLLVFIHGGYWMDFSRKDWSHLAAGAVARGWACMIPSYTLAPEARIHKITGEITQAIQLASARISGPVVVTGHSAGGHLAARMGCADIDLGIARVVPISPLADLSPLMQTAMNTLLRLDPTEAATESPAHYPLRHGTSAHIWVGAQERPAFLWQARTLSEHWECRWTPATGKHHFDVIDDLTDPGSALMETILDL